MLGFLLSDENRLNPKSDAKEKMHHVSTLPLNPCQVSAQSLACITVQPRILVITPGDLQNVIQLGGVTQRSGEPAPFLGV